MSTDKDEEIRQLKKEIERLNSACTSQRLLIEGLEKDKDRAWEWVYLIMENTQKDLLIPQDALERFDSRGLQVTKTQSFSPMGIRLRLERRV